MRANVVYLPICLRTGVVYVPTCKNRANFSFLRANVPINMPTCHTACQCFKLACHRVKRRTKFSNIPLTKCYGKFLYFIIKKKFYIILDIIVIHIMRIWCIVHKNCIRLYFYTSCHIMEKCVELFFFIFLAV